MMVMHDFGLFSGDGGFIFGKEATHPSNEILRGGGGKWEGKRAGIRVGRQVSNIPQGGERNVNQKYQKSSTLRQNVQVHYHI